MERVYLCVHGHFYQPPRQNPFTGAVPQEPGAGPFHDFNEKIWAECYRPNAEEGNFGLMSFDLGPTLAEWMANAHPSTLRLIANSARSLHHSTGYGNALAHAYHHTILPLATRREKRLEIAWGLRDFKHRFGFVPRGMWLAETAIDDETLDILAEYGVTFTVLAPWQAAPGQVDTTEPAVVTTASGRTMTVFFYNARLSGDVSFNGDVTANATRFSSTDLAAQVNQEKAARGAPQLILIATDGELYGHHKPFRDLFLKHLLTAEAPSGGFTVTSLEGYLAVHPASQPASVQPGTSWSCSHGVARWSNGCSCTEGDSSWKAPLRAALRSLAEQVDAVFDAGASPLLTSPWEALEEYIDVRNGAVEPSAFWWSRAARPLQRSDEARLEGLFEMERSRHAMFVSCAWFFEDIDRIEPRIALAWAHRAITLANQHAGVNLAPAFAAELQGVHSTRTGRTGADIYNEFVQSISDVA